MNRQLVKIVAVMVVMLAGLLNSAAAEPIKVGVFDPQRVSEETTLGKRVQTQLTAFRDRKQTEITEKQQSIDELQKQLSAQALSLSSDKRNTLEKNIQRQLLELQSAKESASRELQLEIAGAQNGFQEKLSLVVEQFGKDEGFDLLLERNLVAWSSAALDVTTALVDRFDKSFPPEKEP